MQRRELLSHGVDPLRSAAAVEFQGTHRDVIQSVLDGSADVGAVACDILRQRIESGLLDPNALFVFNREGNAVPLGRRPTPSTMGYPDWVFSKAATTTEPVVSRKANDYVVVVTLTDLEPGTEYFYRVLVNGEGDKYLKEYPAFRFTTSPPKGTPVSLRVAFGSCPKFQDDRVQPMWQVISGFAPDL